VTTGFTSGSNRFEIIDLNDPSKACQPVWSDNYGFNSVTSASGGLLNNNTVLICGGLWRTNPEKVLDDCFAIDGTAIEAAIKLHQARFEAASVVLHGDTLWITGGRLYDYSSTSSTEFVQLTGTTAGPDLPLELGKHCLVSLNDTTVILIGGYLPDWSYSRATFYYNIDHQTWIEGPSLINKRGWHSFALFKSPLHDYTHTVIVTGGFDGGAALASTEFLNVDSNSWTTGTQHNH
jgi:hypothetical protein